MTRTKKIIALLLSVFATCSLSLGISFALQRNAIAQNINEIVFVADNNSTNQNVVIPKDSNNWYNTLVSTEDGIMNLTPRLMDNGYSTGINVSSDILTSYNVATYPYFKIRMNRHVGSWNSSEFDSGNTWQGKPIFTLSIETTENANLYWQMSNLSVVNETWVEVIVDLNKEYNDPAPISYATDNGDTGTVRFDWKQGTLAGNLVNVEIKPFEFNQEDIEIDRNIQIEYFGFFKTYEDANSYSVNKQDRIESAKNAIASANFSMEYIDGKTEALAIDNAMSAISSIAGVGVKGINPTYVVSNDKQNGYVTFESVELASGGVKQTINGLTVTIEKPYDPVIWTYTQESDLVGMTEWDLKTMEIKDNALHIVKQTPKEEDGFDFEVDMAENNPDSPNRASFQMEHYGFLKFMFKVNGQGRLQFYHFMTDENGKSGKSNSRSFVVGWAEDTWLSVIVDFSKTYGAVTVENMETGEIEIYDVYGDNYRKNFTPEEFTGLSERFRFNFGRRNNLEREAYIKYIAFFPSMEQALAYESDKQAFEIDATLNMKDATFTAEYENANTLARAITVVKEQITEIVGVPADIVLNVSEYIEPQQDRVGALKFDATLSYKGSEFTFNNLQLDISAKREIPNVAWYFNNDAVLDLIKVKNGANVKIKDGMLDFTAKTTSGFTLTDIQSTFFAENYKNVFLGVQSATAGTFNLVIATDQGVYTMPVGYDASGHVKKYPVRLDQINGRVLSVGIDGKSVQLSYIAFVTGDDFSSKNIYSEQLKSKLIGLETSYTAKHYLAKTQDMAKDALINELLAVIDSEILIDNVTISQYRKPTETEKGLLTATVTFSNQSILCKGYTSFDYTLTIDKVVNNDLIYDFSDVEAFKKVDPLWNSEGTGNFDHDQENGQIVIKTKDTNDKNGFGFSFNTTLSEIQEYNNVKFSFNREGYGTNTQNTAQKNYTGVTEIIFRRTTGPENGYLQYNLMTCSFEMPIYEHLGEDLCAIMDVQNKTVSVFNSATNELVFTNPVNIDKTNSYETYNGQFNEIYVTLCRNVSKEGATNYVAPSATVKYFGMFNDNLVANAYKGEFFTKATALDGNGFIKTEKNVSGATAIDTLVKIPAQNLTADGLILSYGKVQAYLTINGAISVKYDGAEIILDNSVDYRNSRYIHLLLNKDGDKIELYVDGVKKGEGNGEFTDAVIQAGGFSAQESNISAYYAYLRAWQNVEVEDIIAYAFTTDITAVTGLIGGWRLSSQDFTQKGVVSGCGSVLVSDVYGRLGHEFIGEDYLSTEKALDFTLKTVETWIKITTQNVKENMTVFSSTGSNKIRLEVLTNGNIKFTFGEISVTTSNYNVIGKGWILLSIVIKADSTLIYVNGELIETLAPIQITNSSDQKLYFGYDVSSNSGYMIGFIGETRFWSVERTSQDILAGIDAYAVGNENGLERCYRFDKSKNLEYTDYSSDNANATINSKGWFRTNMVDYDHTIIIVGDTQNHIVEDPTKNDIIYKWILENKDEENIGFVMQAGDFTQNCTDLEMSYAYNSISILNEVLPFVVAMGNHDYPSLTNKGAEIRDSSIFNKYMQYDYYSTLPNFGGTFEKGKMENVYMFFETGNIEWMIMVVEFAPRDEVIEWADYVIANNPDKNVIILTHSIGAMKALNDKGEEVTISGNSNRLDEAEYKLGGEGMHLEAAGTGVATQDGETVNEGLDIWTKLGKRHQNVVQIVSGHTQASTQMRVEEGENGNTVNFVHHDMSTTIRESGDWSKEAMIAIMKFDEDGTACIYQYNPERNAYYKTNFFYSYQLDLK